MWLFILIFKDSLFGSYSVTGRVEKSLAVSTFESGRQDEDVIWYVVNQEAEELFQSTICAPNRYRRKAGMGMLANCYLCNFKNTRIRKEMHCKICVLLSIHINKILYL